LHVPNSLDSYINVAEIQVFAANYCPPRTAVGATQIGGSVCTGAGYGQVCSFVCLPGWIVVSGGLSSNCGGDAWDDAPLVCAPPCPLLTSPTYVEQCQQTFVIEDFNIPGALNRFYSTNPTVEQLALPADNPPQGSTWFQLDGYLQASAVLSCTSDMHLVSSSEKVYSNDQSFTISGSIATQTRAGMVFRAFDDANLMRVWIDVILGYMALERVQNGRVTLIADAFSTTFSPNDFHSMTVSVLNADVYVSVNGIQYIVTADRTFNFGAAGFYAQTSARFDDFIYSSSCAGCSGMTDGDICTFSCSEGLITVGPVARTCTGTVSLSTVAYSPTVEASPLYCTLAAPTFLPATLFVLENSVSNANVGDPLVSYSTSPDFQVQFQILKTYATKAYLNSAYVESLLPDNSLFWVDVCSGQVKVRTEGYDVLNYEGINTYTITVRAFVSGFADAETIRNITISVLNIDEEPIVNPVSYTLVENAAWIPGTYSSTFVWQNRAGSAIGSINIWDPENSSVVFDIISDSTLGRVSVNNVTGLISVSNSFYNSANNMTEFPTFSYESQPNVFTLTVSASQKNNPALPFWSTLIITLVDANDPPLIESNQLLRLLDTDPLTWSAGYVKSHDEDTNVTFNNGTTSYFLIDGGSGCNQKTKWPTVDGLSGGTPLFSIDSTTGDVTIIQSPLIAWSTITPFIYYGKLTRKVYEICVKTLDVSGGSDQQIVTIAISADTPNLAVIKNQVGLTTSMNTQGGEIVTFTGVNFWPSNMAPAAYSASYSNGIRTFTALCQFPSNTIIMCTTAPGYDSGYTWSITLNPANFGASPILSEIDLIMSYGAPTVTSITAPSIGGSLSHRNLPTSTSVEIVVIGTNFGSANSNPVFYYGNRCFNSICHEFACIVKSWTHTNITCLSAIGVGEDLSWELRVGNLSVTSDSRKSLLLSYAPPTITSVLGKGVNLQQLDTRGKEQVVITGNNFGPPFITWRIGMNSSVHNTLSDPAYLVIPMYGGAKGTLLRFSDCLIQSSTILRCLTVGGVGVNHRVSISVGGQSGISSWPSSYGNNSLTSACTFGLCYRPPILTGISGEGSKNADTSGGQLVTIIGRYFGPIGLDKIYEDAIGTVCYGNPSTSPCYYKALNCQVSLDSKMISEMTCLTASGTGRDLQWSVTIGSQIASFSTPLFSSYHSAPPEILSITYSSTGLPVTAANVNGGEVVSLNGRNFGSIGDFTSQTLVQSVSYGKVGSEYIVSDWTAISDSQILVTLPPGVGTDLHFIVVVADQTSPPSLGTFSYAVPTITLVSPRKASTLGGALIAVDANNLPLMDKAFSFSVLLGQERSKGGFGVNLKLFVAQNDAYAIAARTNADGSVRGYFQLPFNFAGSDLGVAIAISQGQSLAEYFTTNISSASNTVFSFLDPVIDSIVVTRGLFDSSARGDHVPCPAWPTLSWSCSPGASVYQLTVIGANFGSDPTKLSASDDFDGVLRTVSIQVGSDWSSASPGTPYDDLDEIFLQEWSHTKIIAFVKQTSGTLRVQLKTQSTYLQPIGANLAQTAIRFFANLNPTISNIAGTTTNIPSAGSLTSGVTITVDGLTGATDFKIFVGGNHINGTEAFIECPGTPVVYPCTGLALTGPSGYITSQSAANAGQAVVKFYPPVGQGLNQPVVAVVYAGSSIKPSNQGFTISYASPVITGFQLMIPPATSFSPVQNASLSQEIIFASTNGTTKLRILGSNFGTQPVVTVGDTNIVLSSSSLTNCDSAGNIHACLEFLVPEGEGNGKGSQYTDLNIDREGSSLPKGFTVFSSTPVITGFSQNSNMVPFSYLPSTITSISSLRGYFPSEGGVQLVILGKNFGAASNPLRAPNPLSVLFSRNSVEKISCLDVQRYSHSQLRCYLPISVSDTFEVVATIAGVVGESGTFFLGNPSPTPSPSPSGSQTPSQTGSPTQTPSTSITPAQSISSTASITPSPTPSGTGTPSQTNSKTPTSSPTSSPTPSLSSGASPSNSPSGTTSPTQSPSQTPSGTPTPTPTVSVTSTPTSSPSPTPSLSTGASSSITPTGTPSPSTSPMPSQTPSQTQSITGTSSQTESPTVTSTQTISITSTQTALSDISPLSSPASVSISASVSPTSSLSQGASPSVSPTSSLSQGASPSVSPTSSLSQGASPSVSPTSSLSQGASPSISPTSSLSQGSTPSTITTSTPSRTSSFTSASSLSSVTPTSASPQPPPPGVQIGLVFGNVNPTIFADASTRKTLEAAFAKAASVNPSIVVIVSIINKDTKSTIFSGEGRRLQTANVEVTSRILLEDSTAASALNDKISQDAFVFSSSVVSFLKTSDSANFAQVSASVSSIKMTAKSGATPSPSSTSSTLSWLTLTVFSSSLAGALLISAILGCLLAYFFCSRNSSKSESSESRNGPQVIIIRENSAQVVRETSPNNFQVSNPLGRESSRPHANVRGRHGIRGLPNIDKSRTEFRPVSI